MPGNALKNYMAVVCEDISGGLEKIAIPVENTVDQSVPKDFEYITESVPSESIPIEDFEYEYIGCKCGEDVCTPERCDCLKIKNRGAIYDANRKLISRHGNDIDVPLFECNQQCTCSINCSNRVVQNAIEFPLMVYKTSYKGWCLRSLKFIAEGSFVCEYAGEILTYSETRKRILDQTLSDDNYIHVANEHVAEEKIIKTYVDPTVCGNVGRFANHSCEPNLKMTLVRVHNAIPRLALFTARDIESGEELTFDYSGNQADDILDRKVERKPCLCNSKLCRKYLPYDSSLFQP